MYESYCNESFFECLCGLIKPYVGILDVRLCTLSFFSRNFSPGW